MKQGKYVARPGWSHGRRPDNTHRLAGYGRLVSSVQDATRAARDCRR